MNILSKVKLLAKLLDKAPGLCAVTGAGCSVESGLPIYRDENGDWKHAKPMQHNDFVSDELMRKHYWARSMKGWPIFSQARLSSTHVAINTLVKLGYISHVITQNVDRLHQQAGTQITQDLHGRLDQVICLSCNNISSRQLFQARLQQNNSGYLSVGEIIKPDGDIEIEVVSLDQFSIPYCDHCGGILKPNVVFFGGCLSPKVVKQSTSSVSNSTGLVVIGSSLMVFSGYKYVRQAAQENKPIVIINQGMTRADDLATLKISEESGSILNLLIEII